MKDRFDPGTIDLEAWLNADRLQEEFLKSLTELEHEQDETKEESGTQKPRSE